MDLQELLNINKIVFGAKDPKIRVGFGYFQLSDFGITENLENKFIYTGSRNSKIELVSKIPETFVYYFDSYFNIGDLNNFLVSNNIPSFLHMNEFYIKHTGRELIFPNVQTYKATTKGLKMSSDDPAAPPYSQDGESEIISLKSISFDLLPPSYDDNPYTEQRFYLIEYDNNRLLKY